MCEMLPRIEINILYEVSAVDTVNSIGHGPKLLTYISQPQLSWPEGWVGFIMSLVPGKVVWINEYQLRSVLIQGY